MTDKTPIKCNMVIKTLSIGRYWEDCMLPYVIEIKLESDANFAEYIKKNGDLKYDKIRGAIRSGDINVIMPEGDLHTINQGIYLELDKETKCPECGTPGCTQNKADQGTIYRCHECGVFGGVNLNK